MTIVRCPRCRDEVTVPAQASRQALVRCPLCEEEYRLSEALADLPPTLIVLGGPDESGEEVLVPAGEAAAEAEGDDYRMSGGFAAGAFESSAPAGAAVTPARPALKGGPRPKRKESSGVMFLVNVVGGGVIGLSLGLLVLWWAFGKDPLDLGPAVSPYAPWIVPAKFHGKSKSDRPVTADRGDPIAQPPPSGAQSSPEPLPNAMGDGGDLQLGNQFDDALRQSNTPASTTANDAPAAFPNSAAADPLAPPSLDDGSGLGLTIDNPLDVTRPASAELPTPDAPPETTPQTEEPPAPKKKKGKKAKAKAPPMPDLTDLLPTARTDAPDSAPEAPAAPQPTPADLASAVAGASAALARYDELPKDDKAGRQQAFTDLFLAGSETGRVISYLSTSDPELADSLAGLKAYLDSISGAAGASKVSAVKYLAGVHWPERKHDEGLLVAGTVKDFQATGPLFEMTLDATSRMNALLVPVVSAQNPQDMAAIGDELVVVGRVIDEPRKNLPGYEGDADRVLLFGHSVKVP